MADRIRAWWTAYWWRVVVLALAVVVVLAWQHHQDQRRDEHARRYACEVIYGAGNCVKNASGHWVPQGSS